MARPGITYAQVAQSAEALTAAGTNPTIAAIRQAMGGTGSPNTIHKHLSAWKGERPQATSTTARPGGGFPEKLMMAIQDEISRAAVNARADMEDALQQAQAEAVELARAGEYIEAERDALLDQIEALKAERNQAQAVADERLEEIERQEHRIEREQFTTETARQELEKAKVKISALEWENQELTRVRKELAGAIKERQDATQSAAVMQAKLEAAERRATEAESRETATAAKLTRCEDQEKATRAELQNSRIHTQAQQIALDSAARKLESSKATNSTKPASAPKKAAPKKTAPTSAKLI